MPSISADEKRWRAEADAHTLAESEVIKNDQARLTEAKKAAKRMAEEERKKASAMTKVSGMKKNEGGSKKKSATKRKSGSTRKRGATHNVFTKL